MKLKKISYTKEEATSLYLNSYRYKILKELKIQEIQKKINNKLLNKKESDNLDLIFFRENISGINLSEMSGLLSREYSTTYNNIDCNNDTNNDTNNDNINKYYKEVNKNKINKYLDLEADCSSEDEEIERSGELEELSDPSFICEDELIEDKNTSFYYEDKEKEDDKILKRLKNKYKKRKPNELEKILIEIEESEEEEEGFSRIDVEIEGIKFKKEEFENIEEEEEEIINNRIEFNI